MTEMIDALTKFRCRLTGVVITPTTLSGLLSTMSSAIHTQSLVVVAGHNLHSAYLYHTEPEMRKFYDRADLILCDGAPLHWDYKISKGTLDNDRLRSPDWLTRVSEIEGLQRICVIGAEPGPHSEFLAWLTKSAPDVEISGMSGENWDNDSAKRAVELIRHANPQLIIIGLGMPLQESFVNDLTSRHVVGIVATVGGAIDQITGTKRIAPTWMGRFGLEWLWRLIQEPRRLWKRYLVEPWKLLWIRIF